MPSASWTPNKEFRPLYVSMTNDSQRCQRRGAQRIKSATQFLELNRLLVKFFATRYNGIIAQNWTPLKQIWFCHSISFEILL